MQAACVPPPLALQHRHGRPGDRHLRHRGAEAALPARRPPTSTSGGARASPSPTPAPTSPSLRTTAVRDGDDWVVNGQKTWTTLGALWPTGSSRLVRTDPEATKQAGISFLLIDLETPGVTVRPIRLVDGEPRGQRGLLRRRPGARRPAGRRGEQRLGLREVPARQRARRRRPGRHDQAPARRRQAARRRAVVDGDGHRCSTTRWSPAGSPSWRARLMALELTVLRVAGGSIDGQARPGVLDPEAARHAAPAGRPRAAHRRRRPDVAARRRRRDSALPDWTRARDADLPQLPQGLHLRRLQRDPAPDHRRPDPGTEGLSRWTSPSTPSSRPCATPSARWPAAGTRPTSSGRPVHDPERWQQLAEMGARCSTRARAGRGRWWWPRSWAAHGPARRTPRRCSPARAGRDSTTTCWRAVRDGSAVVLPAMAEPAARGDRRPTVSADGCTLAGVKDPVPFAAAATHARRADRPTACVLVEAPQLVDGVARPRRRRRRAAHRRRRRPGGGAQPRHHDPAGRGVRRDGGGPRADRRLPQDPQAVRRPARCPSRR